MQFLCCSVAIKINLYLKEERRKKKEQIGYQVCGIQESCKTQKQLFQAIKWEWCILAVQKNSWRSKKIQRKMSSLFVFFLIVQWKWHQNIRFLQINAQIEISVLKYFPMQKHLFY